MPNFNHSAIWILLAIWVVTGTAFIVVPIAEAAQALPRCISLPNWFNEGSETIAYSIIASALFTKILYDAKGRANAVNLTTGLVIASVSGLLVVNQDHPAQVRVIQAVLLASPLMMCIRSKADA